MLVADIIPIKHLLLVALLFAIYYSWVFYISVKGLWGTLKEKIYAICALVTLLLTIEATLELLIYEFFPSFGVYLDRYILEIPDYVPDKSEFRQRWISAVLFIFLLVAIRLGFRFVKRKIKKERKMQAHTRSLSDLLKSRSLNPHFMENFVAVALAREAKGANKESGKMLTMLTQLMRYQLSMDNGQQTTNWQDEWEQVDNLLKMASYGNTNFFYERDVDEGLADMDITIPHGLLLMPLENALKYGKNVKKWPLRLTLRKKDNLIYMRCTNYFNPVQRSRMKSSGTGFQLMRARLSGGDWPIELHMAEQDDLFIVETEIMLDKLQNHSV